MEKEVPGDPIALMVWAAAMLLAFGLLVFTDQIVTYLGPSRETTLRTYVDVSPTSVQLLQEDLRRNNLPFTLVFVLASGCIAYLNARYGIRILRVATFPAPGSRFPFAVQRAHGLQARIVGWCFVLFACVFAAKAAMVAWFHFQL